MLSSPGFGIVSVSSSFRIRAKDALPRLSLSSLVPKMSSLPGYTQIPKEDYAVSSTTSPYDDESEQTPTTTYPPASAAPASPQPPPTSPRFVLQPHLATYVLKGRTALFSEQRAVSHRSRNRLVRVLFPPLLPSPFTPAIDPFR
jgi:hypothetical protein